MRLASKKVRVRHGVNKAQWLGPFRSEPQRVTLYKRAWRNARIREPELTFSVWVRRVLDKAAGIDAAGE